MQLHFMLPYETQWGQNVVISGARGLLGGGDVRKGIRMECTHEAVHGLVWQASMTVPSLYDFSYTYVVVNDREEPEVITAEAEQHHLSVPACSPGTTICVNDTFQVRHRSPPSNQEESFLCMWPRACCTRAAMGMCQRCG